MSLWQVLQVLAGVLGGALLLSMLIPGVATYIAAFFQMLLHFFRSLLEFTLHNLPKPVKIAVFLILFTFIGGAVYGVTIGATHVCVENKVYQVPWESGLSLVLWPEFIGKTLLVKLDLGKIIEQNLIRQSNVTEDGEDFLVTYATVTDKRVSGNLKKLSSTLPTKQFSDSFLGIDITQTARYSICHSSIDGSCILVRPALGTGTGCDQTIGFGSENDWDIWVGSIRYFYEPMEAEDVNTTDEQVDVLKMTFESPSSLQARDLGDCGVSRSGVLSNSISYQVHVKQKEYTLVSSSSTWTRYLSLIPLVGGFIGFDTTQSYDFLVYNAYADSELMVTTQSSGDIEEGTLYFAVRQGAVDEVLKEIIGEGVLVTSSGLDVVQYSCNLATKDRPYDTEMQVLGFNPFNMTTMILISIIEILVVLFFFRR